MRQLFDDTPLFTESPPPRHRPTPVSHKVACSVCDGSALVLPGYFAVPLCVSCRAEPLATLTRIEQAILQIEEQRAKVWQPLQAHLALLTVAEFNRYCTIWVARGLAADAEARVKIERRVIVTRQQHDNLSCLLDQESFQIAAIESVYHETNPVLQSLRDAQHDLLSLRSARDWQISDDITARRATLRGLRPAILETL